MHTAPSPRVHTGARLSAESTAALSAAPALLQTGQRWWARLAMAAFPRVVERFGYTFRAGRGPALAQDARRVLDAVWSGASAKGAVHQRYLDTPTWIVGYRLGRPIACMGLYDVRVCSFSLNHLQAAPPAHLDPAAFRDLSRLAIVPGAQGGSRLVMIGLLREMVLWCVPRGITHILSISVPALYPVFRRYNPTAETLSLAPAATPLASDVRAYHDRIAARVGPVVTYTFDLRGFDALGGMARAALRPVRRWMKRLRGQRGRSR